VILDKLRQGLTAQRIYQDLVADDSFGGSYYSVRRFVKKQGKETELPFRRMECAPGAEAQVDFGAGAAVLDSSGRRRPHVMRVVLSHSRKGYSEAVFRQRTEDFLACLENAFWDFGGVPRTVVIDNLKAAVKNPDWYDPQLNPRILAFCEHYGTVILPTKPYTPRHKGKVERGVGYVQDNALKGRSFASLQDQNRHLQHWESTVADTRIHGTTRQQVCKVFEESERAACCLCRLDDSPLLHEAQRSVHRDGHVECGKGVLLGAARVPGRQVWVRWDGRMVRVFNCRMEQIAVHAQRPPGGSARRTGTSPPEGFRDGEGR
jgi:transposase